jgi:hypothetical protein
VGPVVIPAMIQPGDNGQKTRGYHWQTIVVASVADPAVILSMLELCVMISKARWLGSVTLLLSTEVL